MSEPTCGVCGQTLDPNDPPPTWSRDPATGRPVLSKPMRVDPQTGAVCWCPSVQWKPATIDRRIKGHCPWGCGETLFIAAGSYITCSHIECPRPDGLSVILDDRETDHIVVFEQEGFSVLHPLRERLDRSLLTCDLGRYIGNLAGPPVPPGRYRARLVDDQWNWDPS